LDNAVASRRAGCRPRGISRHMVHSAVRSLILRFLVYAALLAGTFEWIVVAARSHGAHWLMRDDGPVEITQLLAAFCTALLFWLLSRKRPRSADLLRVLSALALMACARALDN